LKHPGIVRLIELFQTESWILLIQEYVPGGNLRDVIKAKGAPTQPVIAKIMRQLLELLEIVHARNIIHRAISLESLNLIDEKDESSIKLGGFDEATSLRAAEVAKQRGKPGFMAPELFQKKLGGPSTKSDIYSAGVVFLTLYRKPRSHILDTCYDLGCTAYFHTKRTRPRNCMRITSIQSA
jgi:serine/threonine protein kinase